MIQRIQTLYLLIVAALMAVTLFAPLAWFGLGGGRTDPACFCAPVRIGRDRPASDLDGAAADACLCAAARGDFPLQAAPRADPPVRGRTGAVGRCGGDAGRRLLLGPRRSRISGDETRYRAAARVPAVHVARTACDFQGRDARQIFEQNTLETDSNPQTECARFLRTPFSYVRSGLCNSNFIQKRFEYLG